MGMLRLAAIAAISATMMLASAGSASADVPDTTGPDIWAGENWIRPVLGPGEQAVAVSYEDHPEDVARVEWWVDGELRSTVQVATIDFGQVSRTVDVEVRAFDEAGNVSVIARKVRIDATAPTITSLTPAQGALLRGNRVWTEFKATDASGLSGGELESRGLTVFAVVTKSPYRASVPVVQGKEELTWRVYDPLGNFTVVHRTVIVDNNSPYFRVIKAPRNGAKVKGTVKVTASVSEEYGIARVELLINGKVVTKDFTAAYKFSINTRKYGKKIKLQLRAYDKAGNAGVTSVRTWYRK